MQYRKQGCAQCVANGGRYCETGDGKPVCSSLHIAFESPDTFHANGGSAYYTTSCAMRPSSRDGDGDDFPLGAVIGGLGAAFAAFVIAIIV